jgi:surface protein
MTDRYVYPAVVPLHRVLCEDALVHISEYLMPTFKENREFRQGVQLWFSNRDVCVAKYGHISNWNTENITDMSRTFIEKESFNEPLSDWNVSNVTDMSQMFDCAVAFNQPLDSRDVSNVTDMSQMFEEAHAYNHPLDSWDVSNVTDISQMYDHAVAFNQALGSWV